MPFRYERYGVLEVERRLAYLGCLDSDRVDGRFGFRAKRAAKRFQAARGLVADGIVGGATLEELFRPVLEYHSRVHGLPGGLLHAIIKHESSYDPGAYYINESGSIDQGIAMLNSAAYPDIEEAQAVEVRRGLREAASRLQSAYWKYKGKGPQLRLECTIASYNSPAGANSLYQGDAISEKLRAYVDRILELRDLG